MEITWIYTIGSAALVSLVSLLGLLILPVGPRFLKHAVLLLVSFSAGALIGDTFIHILPEAVEEFGFDLSMSLSILAGILVFFVLEQFIHWHHCHRPEDQHHSPFVITSLVGDALHNFIDGLFIAASYLVSIPLGIATTLAVTLHEIPQEMGDLGVLLHGGMGKKRALLLNFVFALFAIAGAIVGLLLGGASETFLRFILPFTAGGFLYVANTDLFPELHKSSKGGVDQLWHFLLILAGIGVMMSLLWLE